MPKSLRTCTPAKSHLAPIALLHRAQQFQKSIAVKTRFRVAKRFRYFAGQSVAPVSTGPSRLAAQINIIPLFGSRRLTREADGRSWVLVSASESPQRLTMQESMFVNAALTAARGQ